MASSDFQTHLHISRILIILFRDVNSHLTLTGQFHESAGPNSSHLIFSFKCHQAFLVGVMINFMCQLVWARYSDIWSNVILGVSVRSFLEEIYI